MSYYWISFFGIFATAAIGVLVSALTGEMWSKEEQPELCSDLLVRIWRKPARLRNGSKLKEIKTSMFDEPKCGAEVHDLLTLNPEGHVQT